MNNQLSFLRSTQISPQKEPAKTIISASRRTDIPAFYYNWLQESLRQQTIEISNPMFPLKTYKVDLRTDCVHSIVLWSKDFSKVAKDPGRLSDYNLYFQYTINNYSRFFEPNVPDYNSTLKTLLELLKRYRPEQFNIRFDPIIISNKGEPIPNSEDPSRARLNVFEQLCKDIKPLGLCRVTTSYISFYGHVRNRLGQSGVDIIDFNQEAQLDFFEKMVQIANSYKIKLYSCASPILEKVKGMNRGCCIDGNLLMSLFGGKVSLQKDKGQRKDCQCTISKDIGAYSDGQNSMKCFHECCYCYVR
jgi:Domain of unknown function (DUF1848).